MKRIRVSKLLLQISIREVHNNLISKSIIIKLKDVIYDTTGKLLISDTSLRALMSQNVQKLHTGKNRCVAAKYVLIFSTCKHHYIVTQRGLVVRAKYFGISHARGHRFRTAVLKA